MKRKNINNYHINFLIKGDEDKISSFIEESKKFFSPSEVEVVFEQDQRLAYKIDKIEIADRLILKVSSSREKAEEFKKKLSKSFKDIIIRYLMINMETEPKFFNSEQSRKKIKMLERDKKRKERDANDVNQ